jgi:hypothetical protein
MARPGTTIGREDEASGGRSPVSRGEFETVRRPIRVAGLFALLSTLLLASAAQAQWVFVARKAVGRIKTMTQKENTGSPGYSVAEVILSGSADRVYAAALRAAQASTKARLTGQDDVNRTLEFVAEGQVFGLRVSQVDSKAVHILLASTVAVGKQDQISAVVDAAMRICQEMGATCERVK